MNGKSWVRNPKYVHDCLMETKDGAVVTTHAASIYFPKRYMEKKLASMGADILTLGVFAIVIDDKYYAVSSAIAKMHLNAPTVSTETIEGSEYIRIQYDPGDVVIKDTELVKDDVLPYHVFEEFISRGRVPFFMDYQTDLTGLFDSAKYHAGVLLDNNHVVLEIIAASITRSASDPTIYYRHLIQTKQDLDKIPPAIIPLRSVSYGATNTTAKLVGSYFSEGLDSALVHPSERTEAIETILRT